MMLVQNNARNLRRLLTNLYIAVLGGLPTDDHPEPWHVLPNDVWDALMTTVLDAAEGRDFATLDLPWPPAKSDAHSPSEASASALPPDEPIPSPATSDAEPSGAWRTIDSAPRDGAGFLAWDGKFVEHVAWRWIDKAHTCGWWSIQGNGEEVPCSDWSSARDYHLDEDAPTHWMPLPPPPAGAPEASPRQVEPPIRDEQKDPSTTGGGDE